MPAKVQELILRLTTIYDIAKKTGYSPTTVSKVFNNYPDVREKTRVKILETAKEMGYLPNANARSLTTKRSWTIGILFVEATGAGIRHPYFGAVIESFKKIAVSKGYDLMFISKDVGGLRSSYVEHCKIRGVDGVVVILSSNDDPDFRSLLDSGILALFWIPRQRRPIPSAPITSKEACRHFGICIHSDIAASPISPAD